MLEPDIQHHWGLSQLQGGGQFVLSLKLGPGNVLDELAWEFSNSDSIASQFNELRPMVLGKDIHELLRWTHSNLPFLAEKQFLFLPLEYLKEAIRFHLKVQLTWAELKSADPSDLVCRCFGVSGENIRELVKKESIRRLRDFFQKIQASSGC